MFNKLCIIGVGLIGGSIAKTARQNNLVKEIVGFGREQDKENLKIAKSLGVIDAYYLNLADAVLEVDCVIIATPVASFQAIFQTLKQQNLWSEKTIYTDVGSTKGNIIAAAAQVFGFVPDNFVPAHPIAGAEQSGVQAAILDLYRNKRLIITPVSNTSPEAVQKIQSFWEGLGAIVSIMDAEQHDKVLAATSHLPHLLAFALTDILGHQDEESEIFKYAAGGFRDFTRIASSDPTMWADICMANKDAILPLIEQLQSELAKIQGLLMNDDYQQLFATFAYAKSARQRFLDQFKN
jgi:prephenate dehydrogenase